MRRLVAALLFLAALCPPVATAVPGAPAADVATAAEVVDVPLAGGGHVRVRVPPGGVRPVAGRRVATANTGPEPGVAGTAPIDPATPDESAVYPVGASTATGTTVSIGGGSCEGYPALAATVSPLRLSVAPNGDVYWVERDLPVKKGGSLLIRTLDHGRVRTLTTLLRPVTGRHNRQSPWSEWVTSLSATNRGVYYGVWSGISNPGYTDMPISGTLRYVDRRGHDTWLAGAGYRDGADMGSYADPTRRDGRPAKKTWLGAITALKVDRDENVYFVEGAVIGGRAMVRFLNRSRTTKVFYPGTDQEVRVAPGTIWTIVNQTTARPGLNTFPILNEQPVKAKDLELQLVPSIALNRGVLYVLNVALWNQADFGPPGEPVGHTSVHAVNLGFDRKPAKASGNSVEPGYAVYVAGTPSGQQPGYNGDLRPARGAQLNLRWSAYNGGIAMKPDGTLLIADTRNHRLRAVDPDLGLITTFAGTGEPGYDAGAQPALSRLWNPTDLEAATDGSVLFVDHQNMRIRRYVGPNQPLVDVVGRGPRPCGSGRLATGRTPLGGAYFGAIRDVAAASNGDVFVADGSFNQIRRITRAGRVDPTPIGAGIDCAAGRYSDLDDACPDFGVTAGDDGPFEAASLAEPGHLLVDSYDNLYLSDFDRVRYVNFKAKPISVLGVTVQPHTIATVILFPNRRVKLVDARGVEVGETFAPIGDLALDGHGALYVADPMLSVVYRRGPCGDLTVVAGNGVQSGDGGEGDRGPALAASISPYGDLAYDRAREVLLVYDLPQHGTPRVRGVNLARTTVTEFGQPIRRNEIDTIAGGASCEARQACSYGDGGWATSAGLAGTGLVVTKDRLYVTDSVFHRIRAIDRHGRIGVVMSPVPENTDGRLDVAPSPFDPVTPSGYGYSGDGGPALKAGIDLQVNSAFVEVVYTGVADSGGDLVVADSGRVRLVRDMAHAPISFRPTIPKPKIAKVQPAFDAPVDLRDGRDTTAKQDAGVTYPTMTWAGGEVYVAAARGAGRGCDLWRATDDGWRAAARMPLPADDAGLGAGGRRCGLAAGAGGVSLATDLDGPAADDGTARRLGTAVLTGPGSWSPAAALAGTTDAHPVAGTSAVSLGGRALVVAADGSRVVVSALSGGQLTEVGSIPVDAMSIGDLVVDGSRVSLALVGYESPVADPAVLVATSRDGGRTWNLARVAYADRYAGVVGASRPSLAVARDGRRWVTWSDERVVYLSGETARGWSPVRRVNPPQAFGTLPGVTVAPDGRPVVAYYGADAYGHAAREQRRGPIDDFTTTWQVVVTVLQGDRSETYVVTTLPAHVGQLCLGPKCANDPVTDRATDLGEVSRIALGGQARDLGPVRVAIAPTGAIAVAYVRDPIGGVNRSSGTVVSVNRECRRSLLTGGPLPPCRHEPRAEPPPRAVPPVDAVPELPHLECSPVPPPFPEAEPRPRPRPERVGEHTALAVTGPVVGVGPVIAAPPGVPALPAGHAPAHNLNVNQSIENVTAHQPGANGQFGFAAEQKDEVATAVEYAFAALIAGAAASFAWRQRFGAGVVEVDGH